MQSDSLWITFICCCEIRNSFGASSPVCGSKRPMLSATSTRPPFSARELRKRGYRPHPGGRRQCDRPRPAEPEVVERELVVEVHAPARDRDRVGERHPADE